MARSNVAIGSYVGGGTKPKSIALPFVPDWVVVLPESTTPAMWRSDTGWHGRTQYFHNDDSEYILHAYSGNKHTPLRYGGRGFTSTGTANTAGVTYHYLAVSQGDDLSITSWIGNATAGRNIDWLTGTPNAVFVKRDSTRSGVIRVGSNSDTLLQELQGSAGAITALTTTGITVGTANEANEFTTPAIGEGIEGIAFTNGDSIEVVEWTGNGSGSRVISTTNKADAVLLIDLENTNDGDTAEHVWVTSSMTTGESKRLGATAIGTGYVDSLGASSGFTVETAFNVSSRTYAAIVFTAGARDTNLTAFSLGTSGLLVDDESVDLDSFPAIGEEASTLEFWGRPVTTVRDTREGDATTDAKRIMPLLLLGDTAAGAYSTDDYDGGLYLMEIPFDGWDWEGAVVRWLNSTYLQWDRSEAAGIGQYNLNSGYVVPFNQDLHIMLTHDGTGQWSLFVNGKKVKDADQDMQALYSRINGGAAGAARAVLLGGKMPTSTFETSSGWVYRTAVWDGTELTEAQCRSRYAGITGGSYSGPAPTKEWDFQSSMPSDVTTTATVETLPGTRSTLDLQIDDATGLTGFTCKANASGGFTVSSEGTDANPRCYMNVLPGQTYRVALSVTAGNATSCILRASNTGNTGSGANTYYTQALSGTTTRTDLITIPQGINRLYFIFVMAAGAGNTTTINAATSVEVVESTYNSIVGFGTHGSDASEDGHYLLADNAASTTITEYDSRTAAVASTNTSNLSAAQSNWPSSGFNLNGTSESFEVPTGVFADARTNKKLTIALKFRLDADASLAADHRIINEVVVAGNALFTVWADTNTSQLRWGLNLDGNTPTYTADGSVSRNTDYQIGFTLEYNGTDSIAKLFVDGVETLSITDAATDVFSAFDQGVEFGEANGTGFADGTFRDLLIFSRVLNVSEFLELANGPEPYVASGTTSVSGTETVGATLTCTPATYAVETGGSNGTITLAYQWTRSDDSSGTGEVNIAGATSSTYTLVAADSGKYLRCYVRATNDGGYDVAEDTVTGFTGAISSAGPTLSSSTVNAAGTTLTFVFSENVTTDYTGFDVDGWTLSGGSGSGTDTIVFTISQVYSDESPALDYVSATGNVTGVTSGEPLGDLTDDTISNGSGVSPNPTASNGAASNVSFTTATVSGTVTSSGREAVSAVGAYWSTNPNPTSGDNVVPGTLDGTAISVDLTGLPDNDTIYWRIFATNLSGTGTGGESTFDTLDDPPPNVSSIRFAEDNTRIRVAFSEAVTGTTGFSVDTGTITYVSGSGSAVYLFSFTGDPTEVSYTPGNVVDSLSQALGAFSGTTIDPEPTGGAVNSIVLRIF